MALGNHIALIEISMVGILMFGVMIFVNENIPSKLVSKYTLPDDIEGMFIEIKLRKTKWLILGIYHPPNQPDDYFFKAVGNALDQYLKTCEKFLLLGDFIKQK